MPLRREGWMVNAKRVRRLYCPDGLQMRHKPPRRRVMAKLREGRAPATAPNGVWAMDWIYDGLFDGRRIPVLMMVDTYSRVCPALRVCRVATAAEAVSALDEAVRRHRTPARLRVDGGCQFTSKEVDLWAYGRGVVLDFSRPGKPSRQRSCRGVQCEVPGRMPQRAPVPGPGRRTSEGGKPARRLQRGETA